jgi:hypothetical protein
MEGISPMVPRSLDEIAGDLWPELLRAEGLPEVDEETIGRITRTAVPALRAARDRGAPDYASAAVTSRRVGRILHQAGYWERPLSDASATDFVALKRREITERLAKLRPVVEEYVRLEEAAVALAGLTGTDMEAWSNTDAEARRGGGPRRPRGSIGGGSTATTRSGATLGKAQRTAGKRRARPHKGGETRAAEALSFIRGQPGITIPELAAKMGIKQTYLYRVLPGLERQEKVTKKGRGWYPRRESGGVSRGATGGRRSSPR